MHVTKVINEAQPTSIHGIGEYLNMASHLGTMDIDVNAILAEKIYAALPFCSIEFIEKIETMAVVVKIKILYRGRDIHLAWEIHGNDIVNAESVDEYFNFVTNCIVKEINCEIDKEVYPCREIKF